jgi:hypothetical protein
VKILGRIFYWLGGLAIGIGVIILWLAVAFIAAATVNQ